jgi:hypothetical protein
MGEIIAMRSRSPWLWPDFIFNLLPIGRQQKKSLKVLHGFSQKVVLLFSIIIHIFLLSDEDY